MNFGWNLFTVTLNLFLSFLLSSLFSFLCLLFHPKRQFIYKPLPKRRITELPNCFYTIVSLSRFFFTVVEAALGIVVSNCYALYAHTYTRPRKKKKCMK